MVRGMYPNAGLAHAVQLRGEHHSQLDFSRMRLLFVMLMVGVCFLSIGGQLVRLAMASGSSQQGWNPGLQPGFTIKRADIVDRNGMLLATNLNTASLHANPRVIDKPDEVAAILARMFPDLKYETLLERLDSRRAFVWIKRNMTPQEQLAVNNLGIPGLEFVNEQKRVYPQGGRTAHLLGMVGTDGKGLAGIEKAYDVHLKEGPDTPMRLTLDMRVQHILYEALGKAFKKHEAVKGSGIVLDVETGEVIAMVSLPEYDPNRSEDINPDSMFNTPTMGVYEMGSTFKSFTMAMALDAGMISLNDAVDATKPIHIGRHRISDFHAKKRWMTVPEVFMYSSNIGTAKIADMMGGKYQREFYRKLGLLEPMGYSIPEKGAPLAPNNWGRIATMTASYGHGLAVTPMHVATATAAMINGGELHMPKLTMDEEDESVRVISEDTSEKMRKLLRLVVEHGTAKTVQAKGYRVGGKTGTAEKIVDGRYQGKKKVSSFIGAFPMEKPKYLVMALLDEPKGTKDTWGYATGGWVAGPVVKSVVEQIAPILGIAPRDEESEELKRTLHVDYELNDANRRLASK